MTTLNWEPLGRKVQVMIAELGITEEEFMERVETDLISSVPRPYEVLLHIVPFGEKYGDNDVIIMAGESPDTLSLHTVNYETVDLEGEGAAFDPAAKSFSFPVPDYDEDEAALN